MNRKERRAQKHIMKRATPENDSGKIGSGPIQASLQEKLHAVAAVIDEFFNGEKRGKDAEVGFVIMAFPFGEYEGRCNYMSNARREDIKVLLREQLSYFEGMPDAQKFSKQ